MNPLLANFNTPFETAPFHKIRNEDFIPAIDEALREARNQIRIIRENKDEPDFYNTIEALEYSGEKLSRITRIFFNLNYAETNDNLQQAAKVIAPKLTEFQNDITLDTLLFKRIKSVYDKTNRKQLTTEQYQLLENTYKNFIRNGANLSENKKTEFRKITGELALLTLKFNENVLAETNDFVLHISSDEDLAGLPEGIKTAAFDEAKKRNLSGWIFTLQYPSFMPFMKYADNRELRKKMFMAYNKRGNKTNDHDNRQIIKKIVNLRRRQVKLLGFDTYAAFILDNRMAKNTEKVITFLDEMKSVYYPNAKEDVAEVEKYAKTLGVDYALQRWDWSYFAEKLKEKKYSINDETFRPYFELEKVQKAIFNLANQLYGITFNKNRKIPIYHQDMRVYEVLDEKGGYLAILYLDYFPRKSKNGGAWMTEFEQQHRKKGVDKRPHVSLVFNFTPPTREKPSLLTFPEVRTFLHEFGHALHGIFSNVTYASLAGTEVYRDFVELPSQIMENWAYKKQWLDLFARNYQTGEQVSESLLNKLIESRNYNEAYFGCRQLDFGYLDLAWHTITSPWNGEVEQFEKQATDHLNILPRVKGTAVSTSFGHIFGGGYAAGYYSYKWSEVLDADAFSLFEEKGIFDKETARRFRDCILSKGGTEHPIKLYVNFRGRESSTHALFVRSGFIK